MAYIPANQPIVSTLNSTASALLAGNTFTGTAEDVLNYQSVTIVLSVTGANAVGTLYIDWSIDGLTWPTDLTTSLAVAANSAVRDAHTTVARYFRVRYVNGGVNQTTFDLQTLLDGPKINIETTHPGETVDSSSDAIVTRSILLGQHESGRFEQVGIDPANAVHVAVTWPLSAFSELLTVEPTPVFQVDGSSGVLPATQSAVTSATGAGASVSMSGNRFAINCGTASTGTAYLQSRETIRYRTGQGNMGRFTTVFDSTPRAQNYQLIGPINPENGFAVGYNETTFGFLRRTGGKREIQTLTVTVGTGGIETITITLDGVAVVLPATAGALSAAATAWYIASQSYAAIGRGWQAIYAGSTVIFVAGWAANLVGAFTLTSTGVAAGNFAETVAGAAPTDNWTPKSSWNVDRLDGSLGALNPSGQTLVPTYGNVWQISFQWLGYGAIVLSTEDTNTGRFFPCNVVRYNNTSADTSVANPNLPIRAESSNFGNTNAVTLLTPSLMGATQGKLVYSGARVSASGFRATVGATLTALFSLRIRTVLSGSARLNLNQAILATFTGSSQGANVGRVVLILNATIGSTATQPAWAAVNSQSMMDIDTTVTTQFSGGEEIQQISLGGGGGEVLDLTSLPLALQYGDTITVACQSRAGNVDYNGSLTWFEDR